MLKTHWHKKRCIHDWVALFLQCTVTNNLWKLVFLKIALSIETFVPPALSHRVIRPPEVHTCRVSAAAVPIRGLHLPGRGMESGAFHLTALSTNTAVSLLTDGHWGQQPPSKSFMFQWPSRLTGNARNTLTCCFSRPFEEDTHTQ